MARTVTFDGGLYARNQIFRVWQNEEIIVTTAQGAAIPSENC
jgi:hypothetical protein